MHAWSVKSEGKMPTHKAPLGAAGYQRDRAGVYLGADPMTATKMRQGSKYHREDRPAGRLRFLLSLPFHPVRRVCVLIQSARSLKNGRPDGNASGVSFGYGLGVLCCGAPLLNQPHACSTCCSTQAPAVARGSLGSSGRGRWRWPDTMVAGPPPPPRPGACRRARCWRTSCPRSP